jgi:hypothetical protein
MCPERQDVVTIPENERIQPMSIDELPEALTLIAEITKYCTEHGKQGDCENCPIALAINTELYVVGLGDKLEAFVGDAFVRLYRVGSTDMVYTAEMSATDTEFVTNFDNNRPVRPYTSVFEFKKVPDA